MKTKKNRLKNEVFVELKHLESGFYDVDDVYQDAEGNETTDPAKAMLTADGGFIQLGRKATKRNLPGVGEKKKPLSFSPSDPLSRSAAYEALAMYQQKKSMPNCYMDKFAAMKYTENVCSALEHNINVTNLKNNETKNENE